MPVRGPSDKRNLGERFASARAEGEGPDVRSNADAAHKALTVAATFGSSPSAPSASASDAGARLAFGDGRDVDAELVTRDGATSSEIAAGLAKGGAYAGFGRADGERKGGAFVSAAPGLLGASASTTWATLGGGACRLVAAAAWYPEGIALDATASASDADGTVRSLGAMVFLDAERAVRDLGPQGEMPGRRRIEVTRSTGATGFLLPGVATSAIGIGARLAAGKERAVVYRTSVDDERARALLFERRGVIGWLRDKLRALDPGRDPVTIPDLSKPESLLPGDELVTTVSGSFTAGLFIGGLPLRLGAQGTVRGDFVLGARRLDEHRVELAVTPTRVRAIQGRVGAPFVVEADLSRSTAAAMAQAFVFDLREPAARAAYLAALDGELPGGVENKVKGRRREAGELLRALERERLPEGVLRSFVDQVELRRVERGVSATFGLFFKGGPFGGLGAQAIDLDEQRTRLDARGAVTEDVRGVERRRQVLLSGDESTGVYASLLRSTRYDESGALATSFRHLALTLKLSDTKVRGHELDDEVIALLNERFALGLEPMARDGRKLRREVTVSRTLDETDLARLAALPREGELAPLVARLARGDDVLARARAVQEHVAAHGVLGMAAICRALGGGKAALAVGTEAEAYRAPVEKARELALRYPEPICLDDDNGALAERFKGVAKALETIEHSLGDVAADPFLDDEERARHRGEIERARRDLAGLTTTAHLDDATRRALIERLERGWTTSDERRVIDALARGPTPCTS